MQRLAKRLAKETNRTLRQHGTIWPDSYHVPALAPPREVRHALLYVLQNWRKHLPGVRGLDPRSSAPWFTGWRTEVSPGTAPSPVVAARTWLARVGWRRYGRLDPGEAPRRRRG